MNNHITEELILPKGQVTKKIIGEFWTSKQRQASSIHEVSYRACFKPQLPNYFINKFSKPGDVIYDPFGGRGTTVIEAALLGRKIIQNDINPISNIFTRSRLLIPLLDDIKTRLDTIKYTKTHDSQSDLSMFYDEETLSEILCLKNYFHKRKEENQFDAIDSWIQMVATNRLTGHSSGFFSVYTFPPNQAVSAESQIKINIKRNQIPSYRDTKKIILKKSKQLLSGLSENEIKNLKNCNETAIFLNNPADITPEISSKSIDLIVTSPPFLDIVQYKEDNWLRCWFNNFDANEIGKKITMSKTVEKWSEMMKNVLQELFRVLKNDGTLAFEVGEIRNGKIKLDEIIAPLGIEVGFSCDHIMVNSQIFTKTSNIWGVSNNSSGTNSNRIIVFKK